jgi:ABC-type lipoprotein release transport system permease subunit
MMLWKLALRNLFRNVRRTIITLMAVSVGLGLVIWVGNLQSWQHADMMKRAISSMAGSVVVQAEGYQSDPSPKKVLQGATALSDELREMFPDAVVTRRTQVSGVLMSATNTVGVGLRGVDPVSEAEVAELDEQVVEGTWLDGERGLVLGVSLADKLDVGLGNKLVFMAQTDGEMVSRLFRVQGLFKTGGAELDSFVAIAHVDATQDLYEADDVANQVAVHLPHAETSDEAAEAIRGQLADPSREILPWHQAIPEVVSFVEMDRQSNDILWFMVGIMVGAGVLNTILMSVMERVREFGVMMSVGMPPRSLARMVLAEGFLVGVLGSALGLGIGLAATWLNIRYGLDLTGSYGDAVESAGVTMSTVIYARYDVDRMLVNTICAMSFTVLAACWPAWRVSRMQPVDAMRHQ